MELFQAAREMGKLCDSMIGAEGFSVCAILLLLSFVGWIGISGGFQKNASSKKPVKKEEDSLPDPPRNFTSKQLRYFNGIKDEKSDEEKPIYLSLHGVVFDVSKGRDFYGPGGPYELFAGRECGAALAKMSFDETLLDDVEACNSLSLGEKNELDNWVEKFEHYRCYPIMGKLIPDDKLPSPDRIITVEELAKFDGVKDLISNEEYAQYAANPIYLGAGDDVFDVSFGGGHMYGSHGPYNRFAGKDASRALALMSFDPKDIENASVSDLDEKQQKVLNDWVNTFKVKKGYPIVGKLIKQK